MREPVASATGASLIPMLFMFCDKASLQLESILRIRMGLFTKNDAESRITMRTSTLSSPTTPPCTT